MSLVCKQIKVHENDRLNRLQEYIAFSDLEYFRVLRFFKSISPNPMF